MAKYAPGAGACYIWGTVGHTTFTRTRNGSIFKNKLTHYRMPTGRFLQQQAYVCAIAYAWAHTLTNPQRLAWNSYASTHPITKKCYFKVYLSAYVWFQKFNLPRLALGQDIALLPT